MSSREKGLNEDGEKSSISEERSVWCLLMWKNSFGMELRALFKRIPDSFQIDSNYTTIFAHLAGLMRGDVTPKT